jgi:2-methylcitrate dehydratase PrpD
LDDLSSQLGREWETLRVSLKFYACVGSNHTALDAIRTMQEKTPFGPDDVDEIVVHGSHVTVEHVGWPYEPQGLTSAQLNLPFCVATLLLEGDVFVGQFSDEAVNNERRIALSRKVRVVHDPAITARGSNYRHMVRVDVKLKNGARLEETVEAPRGSERSFASEGDIVGKFMKLATHMVAREKADAVVNSVLGADKLVRAEEIAQALAFRALPG